MNNPAASSRSTAAKGGYDLGLAGHAELAPMADEPTTLAALIEAQAEALGDKPFLYFEDRVISFSEMNRQVNRATNGLAGLSVDRSGY